MKRRPGLGSQVLKRSITFGGHNSSVSLESAFWNALKDIAVQEGVPLAVLVTRIDADRQHANLSSAIRLFVLGYCRRLASEAAPGGKAKR